MKFLLTQWFGAVVWENGCVHERRDFPRQARAIGERLLRIRRGEILEEEQALAAPDVAVTQERLRSLGRLESRPSRLAIDSNGAPLNLLYEAALWVAQEESRSASGERDRFVVQSVRAMDEITRTVNTLTERLRDWYALHFPEALKRISDSAKLATLLADSPLRERLAEKLNIPDVDASIGVPFEREELEAVQRFAQTIASLYEERHRLERLLEKSAREVAPHLSHIVGPLNAARLISQANGLERLAFLPASTVQTLGAETALFLHLKQGKSPPKHGILFQHALVNTAPRPLRGRMARILAAFASRAARIDFFQVSPQDQSETLRQELEKRVANLRQKGSNRSPPSRPQRAERARPRPSSFRRRKR